MSVPPPSSSHGQAIAIESEDEDVVQITAWTSRKRARTDQAPNHSTADAHRPPKPAAAPTDATAAAAAAASAQRASVSSASASASSAPPTPASLASDWLLRSFDFGPFRPSDLARVTASFGWAALRRPQLSAISSILRGRNTFLLLPTGGGKCWGRDTQMSLVDGRTKLVQDIRPGDQLMGDDGTPRTVQAGSLTRGNTAHDGSEAATYRVTSQDEGRDSWACNGEHILVLKFQSKPTQVRTDRGGKMRSFYRSLVVTEANIIVEQPIRFATRADAQAALDQAQKEWKPLVWEGSVNQFLRCTKRVRRQAQMFQPEQVTFDGQGKRLRQHLTAAMGCEPTKEETELAAWNIGMYITTNDSSAMTNPVHRDLLRAYEPTGAEPFPLDVLSEPPDLRMHLLAGVVDGAGRVDPRHSSIEVRATNREFIAGVVQLARGLGFSSGRVGKTKCTREETGDNGFRVSLGGVQLHQLRTALRKKHLPFDVDLGRQSSADSTCAGFTIERVAHADYFGFTLDGNGRCLMGDFTVTHNSACYQVPAVLYAENQPGVVSIVVGPLIALMQDQVKYLLAKGVQAAMLGSSVNESKKREIYADLARPLDKESDDLPANETHDFDPVPSSPRPRISLLFASPEFLCGELGRKILGDLVRQQRIRFVAIDEVHTVSSWGHEFRPSFLKLSFLKELYPSLPLMLLTATATKKVQTDILKQLHIDARQIDFVRAGFNRPNICYAVQMKETIQTLEGEDMTVYKHMQKFIDACEKLVTRTGPSTAAVTPFTLSQKASQESKVAATAAAVAASSTPSGPSSASKVVPGCSGLVYCSTRDGCEEIASQLKKLGVSIASYHAGMSNGDRDKAQTAWMTGQLSVLAATNAFGMGINKANVRFVIHYNLSQSIESYYQESGRCGRDGLPSNALLYYSQSDLSRAKFLCAQPDAKFGSQAGAPSPEHKMEMLESMMLYCESTECRRQNLLAYFNESLDAKQPAVVQARAAGRCCDVCSDGERVKQHLALAKTMGGTRVSGAGMSGMKSEWVFDGRKTDEYESSEERQLTAAQLARRRQAAEDDKVRVPTRLLMGKKEDSFNAVMDYMEAAEAKYEREQGESRQYKTVPFKSLEKARGVKRPRVAYKGSLLGVHGTHTIAELPLAKREDCLTKLHSALKANREFSAPSDTYHGVTSVTAALEYQAFVKARTSAMYLGAIRTLLSNIIPATRASKEWADWKQIDWNKIPTESQTQEEEEEEDAQEEEESGDSSDEEDASESDAPKTGGSASKLAAAGLGFQKASQLVGGSSKPSAFAGGAAKAKPKPASSTAASGSKATGGFTTASALSKLLSPPPAVGSDRSFAFPAAIGKPSMQSIVAASKMQLAETTPTDRERSPLRGGPPTRPASAAATQPARVSPEKPTSSFMSGAQLNSIAQAAKPKPTAHHPPLESVPPSVSQIDCTPRPSTLASHPSSKPSPVRSVAKLGGTLSLSWAHPTAASRQHAAAMAAAGHPVASTPSPATGGSPSRIKPLVLTTSPGSRSSPEVDKRARAQLELTEVRSKKPPSEATGAAAPAPLATQQIVAEPEPSAVSTVGAFVGSPSF